MRRTHIMVVVILTLVTGIMLGKTGALLQSASTSSRSSESGTSVVPVADLFYGAVNYFLESGSVDSLRDVLDPGFQDHSQDADPRSDVDFFDDLRALRAEFPQFAMHHELISMSETTGTFRVAFSGISKQHVSGIPPDPGLGREAIEVLRVQNHRIVERWTSHRQSWRFDEFLSVTWQYETKYVSVPTIQRLTLDPGVVVELTDHQGMIIVAESSGLMFSVTDDDGIVRYRAEHGIYQSTSATSYADEVLDVGEIIAIPPSPVVTISNSRAQTSTILLMQIDMTFTGVDAAMFATSSVNPSVPGGVSLTTISTGGYFNQLASVSVALGRLTIEPGETLPAYESPGIQFVIATTGELELSLLAGKVRTGRGTWMSHGVDRDAFRLETGKGLCAVEGTVLQLRAASDEPVEAWVLTFIPHDNQ